MAFTVHQKVLFKHCDPAGIVFYPRYFEMVNDVVEAFFDQAIGLPFERMHQTGGVPTAGISAGFHAPSRHGDHLELTLGIEKIGTSSAAYCLTATCNAQTRFTVKATLVNVNTTGRPTPWPSNLRDKLTTYLKDSI